jgi:CheY-like chemotaxis protein
MNDLSIILMDIQMPALTGLKPSADCGRTRVFAATPIISHSPGDARDRERCLEAGK